MLSWRNICSSPQIRKTCLLSRCLSQLTLISDEVDTGDPEYQKGLQRSKNVNTFYTKLLDKIKAGGGERAIKRHTVVNKKMLVRDRISRILDPGSPVLELCPLAGSEMNYGNIPAAGTVCVIGKVCGHYCIIGGSDATVKGGAVFPIGVDKQLRAQAIGSINHTPGIHLVDSAGAFLPLQADIFPDRNHGGRVFRNEAVHAAKGIPQVSVVVGSSTAGGAYVPTMTEEAIIVKEIGTIYLGGPPLVKAATGEEVTEQDLGGADMHCRVSGNTDYYAETEEEAFQMCRDSIETFNWIPLEENKVPYEQPLYASSALDGIAGKGHITKQDMYSIISRITDGSKLKEFKKVFGKNLITGYAYIQRNLVGLLANCGPLTSEDGLKGTHFVSMCNRRDIPLVFLQNSLGTNDTQDLMWGAGKVLKDRGALISAHSCATVPKITLNIGGCLLDDNFTMCGGSFKPNFIFSWPLAHTSYEPVPERNKLLEMVLSAGDYTDSFFEETTSAFHHSSLALYDAIVLPQETRSVIALCLEVAKAGIRNKENFLKKMRKQPTLRM